jgi:hypothetical protein
MSTKNISATFPHGMGQTSVEEAFSRLSKIPTSENFMKTWLWGIPKTSALTDETLEPEIVQQYIDNAVSEIEHSLNLFLSPVKIAREQHSFNFNNLNNNYSPFHLKNKPITAIDKIEMRILGSSQIGGELDYDVEESTSFVELPLSWISVDHAANQINLIPMLGRQSFSSYFFSIQNARFSNISLNRFPGLFLISYTCGMEEQLPRVLVELICVTATANLLNMLSPVLFPLSSSSISLDGLSQGMTLPGHNWLTSRVNELNVKKEKLITLCKHYYNSSFNVVVLG